jgi:Leucine-rich repeat (LRR) protein
MEDLSFDIEKYINSLPNDIETIDLGYKNITYIPDLFRFVNLKNLYCDNNQLTYLPNLPNSLETLNCSYNKLLYLPKLPNSLDSLFCYCNKLCKSTY